MRKVCTTITIIHQVVMISMMAMDANCCSHLLNGMLCTAKIQDYCDRTTSLIKKNDMAGAFTVWCLVDLKRHTFSDS